MVGRGALDRRGGFAVVEVCHGGFDVGGLSSRSAAGVSSLWVCCCCHGFSLVDWLLWLWMWRWSFEGLVAVVMVVGYLSIYILDTHRETLH